MTPIASTRKSMKSVLHKLDWFKTSKVKLNISGVLFRESLDEMGQVIDACLDRDVPVQMRAVHDDLMHNRALRDAASTGPVLRFIEQQAELKRNGQKIHSNWNTLAYQQSMLREESIDWTCAAGYKYFFVSSTGKFWLCSQVRTERHILEITGADLLAYNTKKACQSGCGVYCTVDTSLKVSHPWRYYRREAAGAAVVQLTKLRKGRPRRIRDLPVVQS